VRPSRDSSASSRSRSAQREHRESKRERERERERERIRESSISAIGGDSMNISTAQYPRNPVSSEFRERDRARFSDIGRAVGS